MKLIISDDIFTKFPETIVGAVVVTDITPSNDIDSGSLLLSEEARIRASFQKETFTEDPSIKVWRAAYREFGVKPSDAKSSVENLYRLILSGRDIRRISPLVDIYNYISLKYMLPVGGEDLDACKGDIKLCFAGENEPPVKLLGDEKEESPIKGEVIYKDSVSAICRRWNWREADRTKLAESTKNCILVIESLLPNGKEIIEKAVKEIEILISSVFISRTSQCILSKDLKSFDLGFN